MQSTTKKPLTRDLVASARETLEAIPPAPEEMLEVSVTEAIQLLMPTLQRLFKKGYKRAKVVEFLREQGIECSEATLKTLYRAPKSRKDKPGKTGGAPSEDRTGDGDQSVRPFANSSAGELDAGRGHGTAAPAKPSAPPTASNGAASIAKAS